MKCLLIPIVFTATLNGWATCNPALPQTTTDIQWVLKNNQSIVRDNKTGLQWQRCSLGQTWRNNTCEPTAEQDVFNWQQALEEAKNNRLGGFSTWRLPNKKELASLLELSCTEPAINLRIFPNTVVGRYWTSTPVIYADSFTAWFVDFSGGEYGNISATNTLLNVRLVRDGD